MKAPRWILFAATLAAAAFSAAAAPRFRVAMVTDMGGIDDSSFNQLTWQGIERFGREKGLVQGVGYSYLQSGTEADMYANLDTLAGDGYDLVVAPGFLFWNALPSAAKQHRKTRFAIIDAVVDEPNVLSIVFKEHEGSFLAGVAAGLKAKEDGKDAVGFLGGMQFPLIEKFEAGFVAGVKAVYPECRTIVEYAEDFASPDIGRKIAKRMYDRGAYIIFHAAGGTGNGLFAEAMSRRESGDIRWVVGVDKDQFEEGIYGYDDSGVPRSVTLTSMRKFVETASYLACVLACDAVFPAGTVMTLGIAENGVGLPAENPNLSDAIVAELRQYGQRVASGAIKVPEIPKPADRAGDSGRKKQ